MKMTKMMVAALMMATAVSASAGVVTSKGIDYTASINGNQLILDINAKGRTANLKDVDVMNSFTLKLPGLSNLTMNGVPYFDGFYPGSFNNSTDTGTFTSIFGIDLDSAIHYTFTFAGANLDFSKLDLAATFETGKNDFTDKVALDTSTKAPAHVPEPGSLALMGLGMMGMTAVARRRKTVKA